MLGVKDETTKIIWETMWNILKRELNEPFLPGSSLQRRPLSCLYNPGG